MTTGDITVSVDFRKTVRSYSGEFIDPPTLTVEPATTPQVIGYWGLDVTEIDGANGKSLYYKVKLASLRAPGQGRSSFGQDYHSGEDYGRLSLKLVPASVIEAIEVATDEIILGV